MRSDFIEIIGVLGGGKEREREWVSGRERNSCEWERKREWVSGREGKRGGERVGYKGRKTGEKEGGEGVGKWGGGRGSEMRRCVSVPLCLCISVCG